MAVMKIHMAKHKSMALLNYIAVTTCVVYCGCDVEIPSLRKATEKVAQYSTEQMPKEPAEPAASQIADERASLEHFAASRLKMIDAALKRTEKSLKEICSNRTAMSKRVHEISDKVFADKGAGAGEVLLALLKDYDLNRLASTYLGNDFSLLRAEFIAKMRKAANLEMERETAIAENKRNYQSTVNAANNKDASSAKRSANEIAKEKKRIGIMEKRIHQLRSTMLGSHASRMKRDNEIRVLESDIYRTRNRIDWIRRNANMNSSDSSRNQAQLRFDNINKDIERRYKNLMTVHQVAEEYERNTVQKLNEAMRATEEHLKEEMKLLDYQKVTIASVATGIEKLGMASLKEIRTEIEKVLSRKSKANAKGK